MNITIDEGVKATFTCKASGVESDSFTYEWYLNNDPVTGEYDQTLIVTASQVTSGSYTCSVKNQYGNVSESETAVLIIMRMLLYFNVNCFIILLLTTPIL